MGSTFEYYIRTSRQSTMVKKKTNPIQWGRRCIYYIVCIHIHNNMVFRRLCSPYYNSSFKTNKLKLPLLQRRIKEL